MISSKRAAVAPLVVKEEPTSAIRSLDTGGGALPLRVSFHGGNSLCFRPASIQSRMWLFLNCLFFADLFVVVT